MSEADLAKEWLRYAQNDLTVAQHCYDSLHPKQTEIACYHCQQAAEKSLKAYLTLQAVEPPQTHNLVELCQLCMDYSNAFVDILNACADLTPYGVAVRYPQEFAPDGIMAQLAINKTLQIYDFCKVLILP